MDIVTDLASEAVSFLSLFQDICKDQFIQNKLEPIKYRHFWELNFDEIEKYNCTILQKSKIKELVFISNSKRLDFDTDITKPIDCFFSITQSLITWLEQQMRQQKKMGEAQEKRFRKGTVLYTSYQWRCFFREILYQRPEERLHLASILHYMPIQVILCLGGKVSNSFTQRVYQVWEPAGVRDLVLLSGYEENISVKWWEDEFNGEIRRIQAVKLLQSDMLVLEGLKRQNNPVPFETFFNSELDEICLSREKRSTDPTNVNLPDLHCEGPLINSVDPLKRAKDMNLVGLALSGGGIRSATFNLGVLQKLSENGVLPRIDYLSTVSGGGYIGAWFASWVQRAGSLSKVVDRLNVRKSADPMAEDVLPVRWLRMFSNYLNPDASIMSLDSWTVGVTWVRNTLINQTILLLMLCTILSFVHVLFLCWKEQVIIPFGSYSSSIMWWSSGILIGGCLLSGLGMRMYDQSHSRWRLFNLGKYKFLSLFLTCWAIITSFLLSSWIFIHTNKGEDFPFLSVPLQSSIFVCIMIIAFLGNYHTYPVGKISKILIYPLIVVSSAVASFVCASLLKAVELVFLRIMYQDFAGGFIAFHCAELLFIIGVPLILEVISLTVIVRMVLMGSMFPDERREWWGRMGANTHRFALLWILATSSILLIDVTVKTLENFLIENYEKIPTFIGAWGAIVGYAIKLAFNSNDNRYRKSGWSGKEIFIRIAPYFFFLGFLLIGTTFYNFLKNLISVYGYPINLYAWEIELINTIFILVFTLIISWRVGVNEFSLHHFYRNRLVRAYLGATRRRTERAKTANSFTGFDKLDDIKLAKFRVKYGYFGPYPLINTTLNATQVSELDRQDRKGESFLFSSLYCGFDFSPTRSASFNQNRAFDYGFRSTTDYAYEGGPTIGSAMAISGAAVNPNQGHHSSAATAFLLTVFNVRLGWWIGNPRLGSWQRSDPSMGLVYVLKDLVGKTDIDSNYVCLSDGGHFDNMGLYELIRRRCKYIILGDAEQDMKTSCEGLANAIRRCRVDFGVEISAVGNPWVVSGQPGSSAMSHVTEFKIQYPFGEKIEGKLVYIKSTFTGDEPIDIREYKMQNLEFPQQSTADQFFDEAQFESYRKLGYHSLESYKFDIPHMRNG
jgi:hypothetical protein